MKPAPLRQFVTRAVAAGRMWGTRHPWHPVRHVGPCLPIIRGRASNRGLVQECVHSHSVVAPLCACCCDRTVSPARGAGTRCSACRGRHPAPLAPVFWGTFPLAALGAGCAVPAAGSQEGSRAAGRLIPGPILSPGPPKAAHARTPQAGPSSRRRLRRAANRRPARPAREAERPRSGRPAARPPPPRA